MKNKRQLGIYVHIPFCVRKCHYCDFLSGPAENSVKEAYAEALKREIVHTAEIVKKEDYQVETVFFGGGTPTAIDAGLIAQILGEIRKNFYVIPQAEITIECNPGTITEEKARIYRHAGINRISMGLQSADDGLLKMIGRIHTWEDFEQSIKIARTAGFSNINVDIMSALPGQTFEGYVEGLERVLKYEPEHISAYSLILEEGTPLGDNPSNYPPVPDEDTEREMYYETLRLLEKEGYHRYEISNYAKPGYECRHNLSYWDRKDYLGFGVGAASLFEGKRMSNIRSVSEYIKLMQESSESLQSGHEQDGLQSVQEQEGLCGVINGLRSEVEALGREDAMSEFMFLGLRKTEGVRFLDFKEQFGVDIDGVFGEAIKENAAKGLLEYVEVDNNRHLGCRLTGRGIDISNIVLTDFLL